MNVLVNYSGGKDCSTSSVLHLALGHNVTLVCYVPHLTDDIPLIPKSRVDYLNNAKNHFESLGAKFFFVKGVPYYDFCMRLLVKGTHKGLVNGFPLPIAGKCDFSKSKINALNDFYKNNHSSFDLVDIGYTVDEAHRLKSGQYSLLFNLGYTQFDTYNFVRNYCNGILFSPAYITGVRDGCSLCPNAKAIERYIYFSDYPEAIPIVEYMQDVILSQRGYYPLRNKKLFIVNNSTSPVHNCQVSFFGQYFN